MRACVRGTGMRVHACFREQKSSYSTVDTEIAPLENGLPPGHIASRHFLEHSLTLKKTLHYTSDS